MEHGRLEERLLAAAADGGARRWALQALALEGIMESAGIPADEIDRLMERECALYAQGRSAETAAARIGAGVHPGVDTAQLAKALEAAAGAADGGHGSFRVGVSYDRPYCKEVVVEAAGALEAGPVAVRAAEGDCGDWSGDGDVGPTRVLWVERLGARR